RRVPQEREQPRPRIRRTSRSDRPDLPARVSASPNSGERQVPRPEGQGEEQVLARLAPERLLRAQGAERIDADGKKTRYGLGGFRRAPEDGRPSMGPGDSLSAGRRAFPRSDRGRSSGWRGGAAPRV